MAERSSWARGSGHRPLPKHWDRIRRKVLRKSVLCHVCRLPGKLTVDHIVPRSQGGDDSESNLAGICEPCRRLKDEQERVTGLRAAAASRRVLSRRPVERHPGLAS